MSVIENAYDQGATSAVPSPPPDLVRRPLVADLLSDAEGRIVVVTAPPGYGKTSQIAAWAHDDGRAVAWADLEPAHNDPGVLLVSLVRLLSDVTDLDPAELADTLGGNTGQSEPDTTLVAPRLGRLVRRCVVPFVLVLDDVHVLHDRRSLDLVTAVLAGVPAGSTIVLAGWSAPGVMLGRLRVHPGVVEVTMSDLALDGAEVGELVAMMGVELDDATVDRLTTDTEGWPVGVRFTALALKDGAAPEPGASACRGDDPMIADYLREEWLRGIAPDDVELLTRVSGLDQLTGPLCDAVLGRTGCGEVLAHLERTRLVVIPLDRRGSSYRLHHLLRDVLQAELERTDPDGRRAVDARASDWFERAGDVDRALHHAVRAGDLARAERLVGEHGAALHTNGEYGTVQRWLAAFPRPYTLRSPTLCLLAGFHALAGGDGDAATAWLRFGEQALAEAPSPDATVGLRLTAFRALISAGPVEDARADAARAYRGLPVGVWHGAACLAYGALSYAVDDDDLAEELLAEAVAEASVVGAATLEALAAAHLALVLGARDDWGRALVVARSARRIVRTHGLEAMPTLTLVTAVSALVEAMDGDPEQARAELLLTRCNLARVRRVATWSNVQARIALARVSLLIGDRVGARTLVDEAEHLLRTQPDSIRAKRQIAELDDQLRTARSALPVGPTSLTTAELRVLHYLPTNLTHAEIAERLYVSRNTAKSHAAAVYRKLGACSRSEAVEIARAAGLLGGEPLPLPT